jgi:uncharacterized NAD(P)/FAD-binding protein YdhS
MSTAESRHLRGIRKLDRYRKRVIPALQNAINRVRSGCHAQSLAIELRAGKMNHIKRIKEGGYF